MKKTITTNPPKKMGRPSIFTPELGQEICLRMLEGACSLRQVCDAADMPCKATVFNWLLEAERGDADVGLKNFLDQYARACEIKLTMLEDELIPIADNTEGDVIEVTSKKGEMSQRVNLENVQRDRLRVDTRKWILERLRAKKYGEKKEIKSTVNHHWEVIVKRAEERTRGLPLKEID